MSYSVCCKHLNRKTGCSECWPQEVWDERTKQWLQSSGTVRQGRRPMFKPFTKAERAAQRAAFADHVYAASEPFDKHDLAAERRDYEEGRYERE